MSLYENLKKNIEENTEFTMALVKDMYENPEVGNEEFRAMNLLSQALENKGFKVEKGYVVPTGFIGEYTASKEGPTIGFLCEYDALPEVGHGCAHNLIAGISMAAGMALKSVIDEIGGKVLVIGTPAEENFGGKVSMAEAGVFDEVDVAMLIHPGTDNELGIRTQAIKPLKFEFYGKNAHGCKPQQGRSALDAAVLTYMNINLMRQFVEPNTSIHGIIRDGGSAANVIPAYASLEYYFRGETMKYVEELCDKAIKCVEGACTATGTTYEMSVYECAYDDIVVNYSLCNMLKEKYEELGMENIKPVDEVPSGSTDMGSVSYRCPALHGGIKIADECVTGHSKEMAAATISEEGKKALKNGAYSLSAMAVDLIQKPELMKKVKDEFEKSVCK